MLKGPPVAAAGDVCCGGRKKDEGVPLIDPNVAARIAAEREYHEQYYEHEPVPAAVNFDLAESPERKPRNLTWAHYDTVLDHFGRDLHGRRILVVGCGLGDVALNLARNGAAVDAFDVSPKAIDICRQRAAAYDVPQVRFFVSSCEELEAESESYDAVVGNMILHHVDIPTAMAQFHRLLRPGGLGAFAEWKEYAVVDRVRRWPIFRRLFPSGGTGGYATAHERKLNERDFAVIRARFPDMRLQYRYAIRGKLDYFMAPRGYWVEALDYWLLQRLPWLQPFTDGVVVSFSKSRRDLASGPEEPADLVQ
jgi:ubiquinone/menaquinone biosynthesis C-methylase UbiE